jgi:hypothetical protein
MKLVARIVALALLSAPASARAPVETPRPMGNGWYYGEAGNYCMAIRELPDGSRLSMRLAKWNDMSDSLILWRKDLPPLYTDFGYETGRSEAEEEADAEAEYHVAAFIDGRRIPRGSHTNMLADFDDKPGPSYRIGIGQKAFIAALAKGRTLEVRHRGKAVAQFPIKGSAAMAKEMAKCVEKDPSF